MIRLDYSNDTNMTDLSQKEKKILAIFLQKKELQSSATHEEMLRQGEDMSLVTVKRALSGLVKKGMLVAKGSGRSVSYELTAPGRVFAEINASEYIAIDPDKRYGLHGYNFGLFSEFPAEIFSAAELDVLHAATAAYKEKAKDVSDAVQKKELERLIVELSWKSSKIEGNTYTLLDTENLLLKNTPAPGKTEAETRMILNHRDAFNFVHTNKNLFAELTQRNIEELHRLLVKDTGVGFGLRKSPVGVSGSIYRPLDTEYQVAEALEALFEVVRTLESPYGKACAALLGISYIQPFEDGNKRTGRLAAGAILMAHGCAPLSYRSVDEEAYREATLVFYELNSIGPFKKIFIEQYDFSARNYAVR